MSSEPQIIRNPAFHTPARWVQLLGRMPLPLSTCSQRSAATIMAYFLLIALDMLKTSASFAAYINSFLVSRLPFLEENRAISWLYTYFLPETEAAALFSDPRSLSGITFVLFGFSLLGVLVMRRLSCNLASTGDDLFGGENSIRHPHLTALSICGLGFLLLWPRYILLAMYIAMLFGCYFFARTKEHEDKLRYGPAYSAYKKRSAMFLPFNTPYLRRLPHLPRCGIKRLLAIFGIYFVTVLAVFAVIAIFKDLLINYIY